LTTKSGPSYLGAPGLISIEHDDYHADLIGRTEDGMQFFITGPFIADVNRDRTHIRREFIAVFLFNIAGDMVNSRVDELAQPRDYEYARNLEAQRLAELGAVEFRGINVKPFAVEHHGVMMGLIPNKHQHQWWVELLPGNFMALHEPWDAGEYDT
jgi:hypothetical protein